MKYANDLWRRLIYKKSPDGRCVRCRRRKVSDAMHLFAKGPYPHMRFDPDNGAPGCRPCHLLIDCDHEAKLEFCVAFCGPAQYERLRLRSIARGKTDLGMAILELERLTASAEATPRRASGS